MIRIALVIIMLAVIVYVGMRTVTDVGAVVNARAAAINQIDSLN